MRLKAPQIQKLASLIWRSLRDTRKVTVLSSDEKALICISGIILADINAAEDIDKTAKKIIEKQRARIESGEIDYNTMFQMVKKQLIKERGSEGTSFNEERIRKIALAIHDRIYLDNHVDFIDEDGALADIKKVMLKFFQAAEKLDDIVTQKILSLKRGVAPGSEEWEVLYQKYFEEERAKLGLG